MQFCNHGGGAISMVSKNWQLFGAGLSSFWRWEKIVRGWPEQKIIIGFPPEPKKMREKNGPDPLLIYLCSLVYGDLLLCLLQMTRIGDGLPELITVGRFFHTQGYGHVILKIQLQHMTKRNIFCSFLTSMLVVPLVVIYFCNGVNQIAQRLFCIE